MASPNLRFGRFRTIRAERSTNVPAVYPLSAEVAPLAFLAVCEINKLRRAKGEFQFESHPHRQASTGRQPLLKLTPALFTVCYLQSACVVAREPDPLAGSLVRLCRYPGSRGASFGHREPSWFASIVTSIVTPTRQAVEAARARVGPTQLAT